MRFAIINIMLLSLTFIAIGTLCAEFPSASQIERSQQEIKKEEEFRDRIGVENKVLVKRIVINGALSLKPDKIKEISASFQEKLLSKQEIEQILDLLKNAYSQLGKPQPSISYRLKKHRLEIKVEEPQ